MLEDGQTALEVGLGRAACGGQLVHAFIPVGELIVVLFRNAKNLADDRDREREGERGHYIHFAFGGGGIEQVVDDLLNAWAEAFHCAHGEDLVNQGPHAGVVGRVGVDQADGVVFVDRLRLLAHVLGQPVEREGMAAGAGKAAGIAHRGNDIIVTGQDPAAHDVAPMHGVGGAQFVIDGIRVAVEFRLIQEIVKCDRRQSSVL